MDLPHFMTVEEYTRESRTNSSRVRYLVSTGKIQSVKVRSRIAIIPDGFDWRSVPSIMTIKEAAYVLRVSSDTVDRSNIIKYTCAESPRIRFILRIDLQNHSKNQKNIKT